MKMLTSVLLLSLLLTIGSTTVAQTKSLVLIGQMPGRYFKDADRHGYVFGYVEITNQVIQKIGRLSDGATVSTSGSKVENLATFEGQQRDKQVIHLKRANESKYDVIYPGLIDLHKHTKQNNLPIWGEAEGQFANRFEWREWPNYKFAVSGNMNPWVDYARGVECATYRWSELQAMVLGTTYLQGPSACVSNFAIKRVEDGDSYISQKAPIQAPTDLVVPEDMDFLWTTLRPMIQSGKTYEQALAEIIKKHCPAMPITADNINGLEAQTLFKDHEKIISLCQKENLPPKLTRYLHWVHRTIAVRKTYFANKVQKPAAIIAHLAEGRRDDEYNQKEYEIIKLFGLDSPQMNFVHGVGIPKSDYPELAKKDIGLIWSPFSNIILYSQTLDIAAAYKAGVRLAIGSDWVPTGTKSVLEEVKIARRYIQKDLDKENLKEVLSAGTNKIEKVDEELFKMITEYPAKMIGHAEIKKASANRQSLSGYEETAVGTIAEGAMGSLIVVTHQNVNPYTNLVADATEKDINLVIIDGKPLYGNKSYLDKFGLASKYEVLPIDSDDHSKLSLNTEMMTPTEKTPEYKFNHVVKVLEHFSTVVFNKTDKCNFQEEKAMIYQDSINQDVDMKLFYERTKLNLDRVADVTRVLAINLMTQTKNKMDPKEGNPKYALKYFPPLYSCNDEQHMKRTNELIQVGKTDVFELNRKYRDEVIKKQSLGGKPKELAERYK